ncbi:hypothetical protein DPMN_103778 [Dreissena polymorpha]|uniref:Uncharacterized protein n=1 Tax=Dreissena polymorpha TaxID=45954 RepID=A0A9D4HBS4_DREPO|nr:hypothetical protein DPMN_103778 [Dreissena polymorpha]
MLFLGNQISISSSDEGLGVPRWVTADDGLVVIPAVVMAVLKKSLTFGEYVVFSVAAAVKPWGRLAVSEGDDLARGVMALFAPVFRSRMLV